MSDENEKKKYENEELIKQKENKTEESVEKVKAVKEEIAVTYAEIVKQKDEIISLTELEKKLVRQTSDRKSKM